MTLLNLIQSVANWIVQSQPFHVQSKPVFLPIIVESSLVAQRIIAL